MCPFNPSYPLHGETVDVNANSDDLRSHKGAYKQPDRHL